MYNEIISYTTKLLIIFIKFINKRIFWIKEKMCNFITWLLMTFFWTN